MHREYIRSSPNWYGSGRSRRDTVFVVEDEDMPGMKGMHVARLLLLFSYRDEYLDRILPCALVEWFVATTDDNEPDDITGMWMVKPEYVGGRRPIQVIHLESIFRGAHLLPVYGKGCLPETFSYIDALDAFKSFYVNPYVDHHAHQLLTS
jgi:hypothetical protein